MACRNYRNGQEGINWMIDIPLRKFDGREKGHGKDTGNFKIIAALQHFLGK